MGFVLLVSDHYGRLSISASKCFCPKLNDHKYVVCLLLYEIGVSSFGQCNTNLLVFGSLQVFSVKESN